MKYTLAFSFLFLIGIANAQFAPAVGKAGTTAISKDSSVFVNWANQASIQRGYVDIRDKSLGKVIQGDISQTYGMADNKTVSLGDSGVVVYEINPPVINGDSWDFAIFENSFDDTFLELATVEVSSDGENYTMFPPVSLTDTSSQTGTFGTLEATKIHNLAGKYRGGYGTPFDLDSLQDDEIIDKNNIRFIRITDVIGSIDADYARFDSKGRAINDPFPTPFESGGFDLDALGIIHQLTMSVSAMPDNDKKLVIYPSPAIDYINIKANDCEDCIFDISDVAGNIFFQGNIYGITKQDISKLKQGIYFIKVNDSKRNRFILKSFVKD